jgi:hypothetical protein
MSVAAFILNEIFRSRLQKGSVLAVYDPDRRYHDLCQSLADADTALVDASESSILAREGAMLALAGLGKAGQPNKLLVYIPAKRPVTDEERQKDPYAVYSACGAIFPDGDGDGYESLCLKAKPDNATEIRRLFAEDPSPPFALIDNVGGGLSWPTLRTCLRAESAREILLALLAPTEKQVDALKASEGWAPEAKALLVKALGLKLMTKGKTLSSIADELWRYLLFSEFAFDLPSGLPAALSNVPRAPAEAKILVEDLCDTLRGNILSRSEYIARAEGVESELDLPKACSDLNDLGKRDTFPFEERTFLAEAAKALCAEEMDRAKQIVGRHGASVWIGKGTRRNGD